MTDDDAELVALIDNELDESRRTGTACQGITWRHRNLSYVAVLGVPIGTIMSRLSAGRAALAKLK